MHLSQVWYSLFWATLIPYMRALASITIVDSSLLIVYGVQLLCMGCALLYSQNYGTNVQLNVDTCVYWWTLHSLYPLPSSILLLIASARGLLILQYNLAMHCMYVSHTLECNYNCGDHWWSLPLRARLYYNLTTVHVQTCVIKPCAYGVHVLGMERRKELARLRKWRQRERDGWETHLSEGQSTMIIDALPSQLV